MQLSNDVENLYRDLAGFVLIYSDFQDLSGEALKDENLKNFYNA